MYENVTANILSLKRVNTFPLRSALTTSIRHCPRQGTGQEKKAEGRRKYRVWQLFKEYGKHYFIQDYISKGEYKKHYIDKLRCCLILFKGDSGGKEAFPCPSLVSFRTSQEEQANKSSSSTAFSSVPASSFLLSAPALTSRHYGLLHGSVR